MERRTCTREFTLEAVQLIQARGVTRGASLNGHLVQAGHRPFPRPGSIPARSRRGQTGECSPRIQPRRSQRWCRERPHSVFRDVRGNARSPRRPPMNELHRAARVSDAPPLV